MDYLQVAKKIEMEGYNHYTTLATETIDREIRGIFMFLAQEEKRHLDIFEAWEKGRTLPPVIDTGVFDVARNNFQKFSEQFNTGGVPAISYEDVFQKAFDFENKSFQFYTELLNGKEVITDDQRTILKSIIEQETTHVHLMSSLLEFLRHPGEWLENAEWRHADAF